MKRFTFFIVSLVFLALPGISKAATLLLSPQVGNFSVGSTFNVSILLDTKGQSVNALEVSLSFPPDMLQVISPSTGRSIIEVWTASPKFDNKSGKIELRGGIPGGISASSALVSTVTFRVKSVGESAIKFLDNSKVLLNDGLGTNVLNQTVNGVYGFNLPPPAGPTVVSDTNPDQATWYSSKTVSLKFISQGGGTEDGYSYILSDNPTTIPDDISEGKKNSVSYTNLTDGTHYFHVKAMRAGSWGGTTHFAIKIDSTPPADFKIDIAPSARTSTRQPIIQFLTTDTLSGIESYDLKIVPLSAYGNKTSAGEFFIEAESPYFPQTLSVGNYDVIVRAYDKSGNFREVTKRLQVVAPVFSFISADGIKIWSILIPWIYVWIFLFLCIIALAYLAHRTRRWRHTVHSAQTEGKLPEDVQRELEELKKYREKYGTAVLVLALILSLTLIFPGLTEAQTPQIAPPLIQSISKNISNEEIFYVGGKTDFADEKVIIYLQNLQTGETFSQYIESDSKGDWFYRHGGFLSPGNYLLWTQGKIGEELSPPSPQAKMTVSRTAVEFGSGRLSYEMIYLLIVILLSVCLLGLGIYIIFHLYHGKKKHAELKKDIMEAEESIKRGFAVLKRDIEAELRLINKMKLSSAMSAEEKIRENQLLSDLENIQQKIGQEIWEISEEA